MKKAVYKILIAEWVPGFNKGELAILVGMLKTFECLGNVDVSIFSMNPSSDKKHYPSNLKLIDVLTDLFIDVSYLELIEGSKFKKLLFNTFSLIQHFLFTLLFYFIGTRTFAIFRNELWREYYESDVIIIAHNQVNCVYGFILYFSPIYISLLAHVLHKPVVIYANGSPGFHDWLSISLAKLILNNSSLITVRDEISFNNLKTLVPQGNIHLTADPAVLLSPAPQSAVLEIFQQENIDSLRAPLIGVTLTSEVLTRAFPQSSRKKSFEMAINEISTAFDLFIEKFGASFIFLPHCIEPYMDRDDRVVSKIIMDSMKHKDSVRVIMKEYSPEELKGVMGRFDMFLGARVHSVIGALTMGVPSIVFTRTFDTRAAGLVGIMLNQSKYVYNIESIDRTSLLNMMVRLFNSINDIKNELLLIVSEVDKKSMYNGKLLNKLLKK